MAWLESAYASNGSALSAEQLKGCLVQNSGIAVTLHGRSVCSHLISFSLAKLGEERTYKYHTLIICSF